MTAEEIQAALKPYTAVPARIAGLCIYREAQNQSQQARIGVGKVVFNRGKMAPAQGFEKTVSGNVLKPYAFSSFNQGDPNSEKFPPSENDMVWQQCLRAARSALSPMIPDQTKDAVFYHDSSLAEPPEGWGPVIKTVQLGNLTFYKIGPAPKPASSATPAAAAATKAA